MTQNNKAKAPSKIGAYFKSENFKPTKLSKYFWIFSATIFVVGVILLCTIGFNLGLDFTGGNVMTIQTGSQIEYESTRNQVENTIEGVLRDNGVTTGIARSQIVGSGEEAYFEFQYQNIDGLTTDEMNDVNTAVQLALEEQLGTILTNDFTVTTAETKSASATGELLTNSFLALAIAIVAILVYVAVRFDLVGGLSAVITLFHDVLLMCALVLIFRIEINAAFIAALITILGYSVNNTIVVFDRVRENMKKETLAGKSNKEIADISVRETLTRTFYTSLTTIISVVFLAIIGVSAIQEFIIPIIFGLIVGTYAAIFISAPLWAQIITNSRFDKRKLKAQNTQKTEKGSPVVETTADPVK